MCMSTMKRPPQHPVEIKQLRVPHDIVVVATKSAKARKITTGAGKAKWSAVAIQWLREKAHEESLKAA